jgi:hypothetical protein
VSLVDNSSGGCTTHREAIVNLEYVVKVVDDRDQKEYFTSMLEQLQRGLE